MEPRFDPGGFYEFNLAEGAVRTRHGSRVLVLAEEVLGPMVAASVRNGDLTPVRRLGGVFGRHVAESLGEDALESSPETVLGHCASVLALFGWGRLTLERWGDALVASVQERPRLDDRELGLAALLGGVFSALARRDVACVPVRDGRFLIVDPAAAEKIWGWAKDGVELTDMLARLHRDER